MVVPTPRIFPKCAKCESTNFSSHNSTFKKINVLIIFCEGCGAVQGIVNVPEKKSSQAPG